MPKQMIYPHGSTESPDPDRVPFTAAVSWARDRDVQLGVQVTNPERSIVDLLFGGEHGYMPAIGQALLNRLDDLGFELAKKPGAAWHDEEAVTTVGLGQLVLHCLNDSRSAVERDGIWASLDRAQINDTIRALRKGRGEAYGEDA